MRTRPAGVFTPPYPKMVSRGNALFHESIEDALGEVIQGLGGHKAVGAKLWPEKSADDAGRLLRHCLTADRPEKLSLEQLLLLLREGGKGGHHGAMRFILRECGYDDPRPLSVDDAKARLAQQVGDIALTLKSLTAQLERFTGQ